MRYFMTITMCSCIDLYAITVISLQLFDFPLKSAICVGPGFITSSPPWRTTWNQLPSRGHPAPRTATCIIPVPRNRSVSTYVSVVSLLSGWTMVPSVTVADGSQNYSSRYLYWEIHLFINPYNLMVHHHRFLVSTWGLTEQAGICHAIS